MKIRSIRFRNINSLKGDFELAFDKKPLSDAGIFAITGPIGSGKTSILDALTLGLYGETPKFGPTETKQVMTRKMSDCYSEVVFSVNGDTYRSRWGVRMESDEILPPMMELMSVGKREHVIENNLSSVREKIAQITGMDFEKFTKTALLTQGGFAGFLDARESDRVEILEKSTGSEMYEEIASKSSERLKAESEKLERLKKEKASMTLLTDEEIQEIEEANKRHEVRIQEIDSLVAEIKKKIEWLKEIEQANLEIKKLETENLNANSAKDAVRGDMERLEVARNAQTLKKELDDLFHMKQQAVESEKRIAELESGLPEMESRQEELKKSLELLSEEVTAAIKIREEIGKRIETAILLDRNIQAEEIRLHHTEKSILPFEKQKEEIIRFHAENEKLLKKEAAEEERLSKWIARHKAFEHPEEAFEEITEVLVELKEIREKEERFRNHHKNLVKNIKNSRSGIKKAEQSERKLRKKAEKAASGKKRIEMEIASLSGGEFLDTLRKKYQSGLVQTGRMEDLVRIGETYEKTVGEKEKEERRIFEAESDLATIRKKKVDLVVELDDQKKVTAALEKIVSREQLVLRFDTDRKHLSGEDPCPLCGSESHPFVSKGLPGWGEARKDLVARNSRIKSIRKKLKQIKEKEHQCEGRLRKSQKRRDNLSRKIEELEEAWGNIHRLTGGSWSIRHSGDIRTHVSNSKNENRRVKRQIRSLEKAWKKLEDARRNMVYFTEGAESKAEERERLARSLSIMENEVGLSETEIEKVVKAVNVCSEKVREKIAPFHQKVPPKGKEDGFLNQLRKICEEYGQNVEKYAAVSETLRKLQLRKNAFSAKLPEVNKKIFELESKVGSKKAEIEVLKAERRKNLAADDPAMERKRVQDDLTRKIALQKSTEQKYLMVRKGIADRRELIRIGKIEMEKIRSEIVAREGEILEKVHQVGFSDINAVEKNLLPPEKIKEMEDRISRVHEKCDDSERSLQEARGKKERLEAQKLTEKDIGSLTAEMNTLFPEKEKLISEIETGKNEIENQKRLREQFLNLEAEIEKQEKETRYWELLNKMKNAREGIEFKKAAQAKTLENLINEGNTHLKKMTGRYAIRRKEGRMLEIETVDTYQAGENRSTDTLSGGEKFLASLAMALGLSEMSGKKAKAEFLFVDENFGLLDEESLGVVFSALEKLRDSGRVIGIISHLESIQKRVLAKIRVERCPDDPGASRIFVE